MDALGAEQNNWLKSKIRTRNNVSDDYVVTKPPIIEVGYNCMGQCTVGRCDIVSLLGKPKFASVVRSTFTIPHLKRNAAAQYNN